MIISTPNWNQEFPDLVPQANGDGSDGEDGKDGKDGPQGRYYRTNKEHKDSLQRGATTWKWLQNIFRWRHHPSCRVVFPPAVALFAGAAKCFDCRTPHFVRINWYFGLPENKSTAGGKAALKLGWWRHQKWFWPYVAVVAPLRSKS